MKLLSKVVIAFLIIGMPFSLFSQTQWISDTEMQFKIQAPNSYKQNQFFDGTDKILALVSPDENIVVRIRAMKATVQFTPEILQQVFEQNIINGANRILNETGNLNEIPAQTSAYTWKFNNVETVIGAYYIIQNGFAYIVWSIVPRNFIQQRSAESDKILNSFELLNPANTTNQGGFAHLLNVTSTGVTLNKIEMGTEVNSNLNIIQSTAFFSKNAHQINVGFSYFGNPNGNSFQLKWYSEANNIYFNETIIDAPQIQDGHGYGFISNHGNPWPSGNYRVEVWWENKKLGASEFQVN